MAMATPVRRHRGGAMQDRPAGWARNPLTEFDQLLSEMSGLMESTVASAAPVVARMAGPCPHPLPDLNPKTVAGGAADG